MLKTAVINNLENIQKDNGDKKVAIVTFNDEVCIVGDGLMDKVILNDEAMNSKEIIETFVRSINRIEHIGHNPGLLINKVLEYILKLVICYVYNTINAVFFKGLIFTNIRVNYWRTMHEIRLISSFFPCFFSLDVQVFRVNSHNKTLINQF